MLQQNGRSVAFGKSCIIAVFLTTFITIVTSVNGGQVIETENMTGQLLPEQQAIINLPASLFNRITTPNVGMFFGFYKNATLFPVGGASTDSSVPRQPQVCSNILAATVGQNIESDLRDLNSEESVTLTFRLEDKLPGVVSL